MKGFPLRPSSSGFCERRLSFETAEHLGLKSYPKETLEPRLERLFDLGHSVESHVIKFLYKISNQIESFRVKYKQQALYLFDLQKAKDEVMPVIGHLDLAIELNGEVGFYDVKSYGEKWSNHFKTKTDELHAKLNTNDWSDIMEPLDENGWYVHDLPAFLERMNDPFLSDNFYQLNSYCHSEFAERINVRYGSILKYNKNSSSMYEIRFTPSRAMFDEVQQRFQNALTHALNGTPEQAKAEAVLGSARCGFCRFKAECWPEDDALKAHFKTWPKKNWPKDIEKDDDILNDFGEFIKITSAEADKKKVEQALLSKLLERGLKKVRLPSGEIFEVKSFKSNGGYLAIRRTKL